MSARDMQCTQPEMKCRQAKALFSPYLDGAVTGAQMHGLQVHLTSCAACHRKYQSLRQTQQLLSSMGRPRVPADLGLKLRLAISREAAQAKRPPLQGLAVRLENAFRAFMVPATAGFLLIFTTFRPAYSFTTNRPTSGRAVLSFSKISVRG